MKCFIILMKGYEIMTISMAELARRMGKSPQALNAKLKRESFTIEELDIIADAVNAKFLRSFELSTGDKI